MSVSAPPEQTTLAIRHVPGSDPASFQVARLRDGKTSQPVPVLSPIGFPVEGRPNSDLMRELQWYLEIFLDYPFPPETEHAERVLKALRDWGEQAFRKLFDEKIAGRMFDAATKDYSRLHLQISSDDPRVLAWPWEALRDPELGFLAHTCQVERCLNTVRDAQELPESLPKDRVNILLVVARPYGKKDVSFRSIARPLVELIEKEKLPAFVELLRPPTFDRLLSHLRERPGFYHILHFDGHGAYSTDTPGGGGYTLQIQGPEGKLVFETVDGEPDPIAAEKLSALLKEYAVPGVVLNACQSAMVSSDSSDPFSSVAMALLRSGMRDVVAMAYSLYVSGAQQFLPAFYRRLFEAGSMAVAVRAGRQEMWQHDQRTCVRGKFPLQDWLLPVLYQQDPLNFSFATELREKAGPRASRLPEELRREKNPYGFVGRDSALLEMERAMRRPPAGILIQGLGGVGKTTLARGFLQWLDQTGGLEYPPFWFSFQEIRSAEYVFNRMGEALFGGDFPTLAMERKIEALAGALREHRLLIVWDNFESAAGIAGTAVSATLPEADRELLAQFLGELRGGATKVIITSRSPEDWLGPQRRFLLPLGGLDREERWEYCNAILHDLGSRINRNDKDLVELMDLLGGHPLAMRAILPRLEKLNAAQVLAALRSNLAGLKLDGDEDQAKLHATLAFVAQLLPEELSPLLVLLGMHEGFVTAAFFEIMAKQVDAGWLRDKIDALMQALVSAGLLRDIGQATYEMHPLLTSYLRSAQVKNAADANRDGWARAFVDIMGHLADELAPRQLHEQRGPFHLHGQNFHYALAEAERLGISSHMAALTQSLAAFAQNNRNFAVAQRLFERLVAYSKSTGDPKAEAAAYHQLGRIAEEQRDFAAATEWYRKSLAIREKQGDEQGAASTYHQLGLIAQEQRDFAGAEQWYGKSLAIEEKQGNKLGAALSYGQLGNLATKQRNFAAAGEWYGKSLAITEKHGIEHITAGTYHQLGRMAEEQRDFAAAGGWYGKSLAIREKQGDEQGVATTYHHLGIIAQSEGNFAGAEEWYRKSLAISEKLGIEYYAASSYGQLGILAGLQGNFLDSGRWLVKSVLGFLNTRDQRAAARNAKTFMIVYKQAAPQDQEKLKAMWQEAGLGELPDDSES
jgi:tetratricopeptide (TPR) repeat protein